MSQKDQYFSGAEALRDIDLAHLVKGKGNFLGRGNFSDVYTVRDKEGNTNTDYVVKILNKSMFIDRFVLNIRRTFGDIKSESSLSLDPNFRAEVYALVDLKGQQIGPDIVYANYQKYYYVIEKMDSTLLNMIVNDTLTPSQVIKLIALGDRYLRSKYFHDDMHTNNIMWSDKHNDFRIIDWGIYLIIRPYTEEKIINLKIYNTFTDQIMWIASLYTLLKIEEGGPKLEQWMGVADKISSYIEMNYPERKSSFDIFDPNFKAKKYVRGGLNYFKEMREDKYYKGGKTRKHRYRRRNKTLKN